MGKNIGIKLADGTFYPVIPENEVGTKKLGLSTMRDGQTEVHVDLYRSVGSLMADAEYVGSLQLDRLAAQSKGELDIDLTLSVDETGILWADLFEEKSGSRSIKQIPHAAVQPFSLSVSNTPDYRLADGDFVNFGGDDSPPHPEPETPFPAEAEENPAAESFPGELVEKDLFVADLEPNRPEVDGDEAPQKKSCPWIPICIICALICAAILCFSLFLRPPKRESLPDAAFDSVVQTVQKDEVRVNTDTPAQPEPPPVRIEAPPPAPPSSVVTKVPDSVVPAKPKPANPAQEAVRYRIKWGDTLWDLAGTYYKNPWQYRVISRYNGIKNPDRIIAGTIILIPPR
ncbi:MAG: LysM peptidoglycan-binding domain-containing protein [Spirochaetaceae bacterium]|jgi:hypothetical protein|nr:LysM peptidoglycan-binding domain-containing protein [Spirochaetaceae bacterium]